MDMDNRTNKVFPSFDSFSSEFSPRDRLIDVFPSCFSFHFTNRKSKENIKAYIHRLNKITLLLSADPKSIVIVLNTSIKNQVATLIAHIHIYDSLVVKTIYHAINVTTTEAELFTIRCGINQATYLNNINWIIVITDSIHTVKRIFDSSLYPYQIHVSSISSKLREFFTKDWNNSMEFWDCPSCCKWTLYNTVDKETKKFNLVPNFPCKSLWDFRRKNKCNTILNSWKMIFQASDSKGQYFLELLDENLKPIKLLSSKGGLWLKFFRHSNLLCARASRAIVNHAPIGKYWLIFFPKEEFKCLCRLYPIETRWHILHECRRYNNYWNLRRDMMAHFTLFLEFNSSAFSFGESIT